MAHATARLDLVSGSERQEVTCDTFDKQILSGHSLLTATLPCVEDYLAFEGYIRQQVRLVVPCTRQQCCKRTRRICLKTWIRGRDCLGGSREATLHHAFGPPGYQINCSCHWLFNRRDGGRGEASVVQHGRHKGEREKIRSQCASLFLARLWRR